MHAKIQLLFFIPYPMNQYLSTGLLSIALATGMNLALSNASLVNAENTSTQPNCAQMQQEFQTHQALMENVTRQVELLDNGAQITLTTDDEDTLAELQKQFSGDNPPFPKTESVTHSVELLSNGVQITVTSEDVNEVERIQKHAQNPRPFHGMGHPGQQPNPDQPNA
jgi:hypothetical protein